MRAVIFIWMFAICLCGLALSQSTETVLYSFGTDPMDGIGPTGGLVFDSAGNIYGTTNGGGQYCQSSGGCGTLYELSPSVGGGWNETVLYNFCTTGIWFTCPDGSNPLAGLIMDGGGNLYGTTAGGGTGQWGTVFRLSPPSSGNGNWTETVLWNFAQTTENGFEPGYGRLNMDAEGNIYGTTTRGGTKNLGTVFELTPLGDGTYSFAILHSFSGLDGAVPQYGVAIDTAGNLYGTTENGGRGKAICSAGCGVVYELSPSSNGTWEETALYKFDGIVGAYPISPVSIDKDGSLYGTFFTGDGGSCYFDPCGGVFKLIPQAGGSEKKYIFYFNGDQAGGNPQSGVMVGGNTIVYGTGTGNIYMLKDKNETVLYNFCSLPNCVDGLYPSHGTLVGHDGALYGAAYAGGEFDFGVVYSLTK
jgi:uncharacterized repeat protein (TIGR03803 family)